MAEKKPSSPEPTHNMEGDYVALMETNGQEYESWLNFIRVAGNEEALAHLQKQLEEVDWYIVDDLSTFDLDLVHKVSAKTAKEMTKLELNSQMFHRKFDGKLKMINFRFEKIKKKKKSTPESINEAKICRVFDILGYGQIEEYISDEDLDPEDLAPEGESSDESSDDSSEESSEETAEQAAPKKVTHRTVPQSLRQDLPGWIKRKK